MRWSADAAYRTAGVQTAGPQQLVLMLYDGAIRFLIRAHQAAAANDAAACRAAVTRAQAIFVELTGALDMSQGELAENLAALYDYWNQQLLQVLAQPATAPLEAVLQMVRSVREAWAEASRRPAES